MTNYTVTFTTAAARQLRKLPRDAQSRVAAGLTALEADPRPHGVKSLQGDDALRLRVGGLPGPGGRIPSDVGIAATVRRPS
jgi:mRNA-degrading endonuclease RelE of RelBE toxin-antitoxin system